MTNVLSFPPPKTLCQLTDKTFKFWFYNYALDNLFWLSIHKTDRGFFFHNSRRARSIHFWGDIFSTCQSKWQLIYSKQRGFNVKSMSFIFFLHQIAPFRFAKTNHKYRNDAHYNIDWWDVRSNPNIVIYLIARLQLERIFFSFRFWLFCWFVCVIDWLFCSFVNDNPRARERGWWK